MTLQYATFDSITIGPSLATSDGGLVCTTLADALNKSRVARSSFGQTEGQHFVGFFFYGDNAGCPAVIGICKAAHSLSAELGSTATSVGWNLTTGEILVNGVATTSGIAAVGKENVVCLLLDLSSAALARVVFFLDRNPVGEYSLGAVGDEWFYGVSMGSTVAGDLSCFHNSGQQDFYGDPLFSDGWVVSPDIPAPVRIATEDYLSRPDDALPNVRFEGCIGDGGLVVRRRLSFWPWGDEGVPISVGDLQITDPAGDLDVLLGSDFRDAPVSVLAVERGAALDSAETLGTFALERVEVLDDMSKRIVLRDKMIDLDVPVQRNIYPPSLPALAFRPIPLAFGACRSIPITPHDAAGLTGFLSELGVVAIGDVRDRGDILAAIGSPPDYTFSYANERIVFEDSPLGPAVADVSSIGDAGSEGTDIFGGDGAPFAGTAGATPTGWTAGSSSGGTPTYEVFTGLDVPGGPGHPPADEGVQFTSGALGGRSWIYVGTMADATYARYRIAVTLPSSGQITFGIAWGTDATDLQVQWTETGYYEGVLVNRSGTTQTVYLLCTRDGSSDSAKLTYATLNELTPTTPATDLLPQSLEGLLSSLMAKSFVNTLLLSDAYAIDQATGYAGTGLYIGHDETPTLAQCIARILPSYTASIWQADNGDVRLTRMVAPEDETSVGTILRADLARDLRVIPDQAPGLSKRAYFQRNWYQHQPADYVTDTLEVSPEDRVMLSREYRQSVTSGVAVANRYAHAQTAAPVGFLFEDIGDARDEINRIVTIYSVERSFHECEFHPGHENRYTLGEVWTLTYPRYGLAAGKQLLVVGVDEDLYTGAVTVLLWG